MGLEIREVIGFGRVYLKALLPELNFEAVDEREIRMEEIEQDGPNWRITFSFPNPNFKPNPSDWTSNALMASGSLRERIAKIIVVDGVSGDLVALKQREAA